MRLADWVDDVTAPLTDAQLQTMLQVEHGGMVEVLLDLYAATGNERYRNVARRFEHRAVLEPLRSDRDELAGKHANTQIPKITGAARSFETTGTSPDRAAAEQFWRRVVRDHSWVIGGNSDGEHFFAPHTAANHLSAATAETCNTYNMLKLTEHLFTWQPQVEYADYYERALYNHILASQEPRRGMFAYFMSLKPGHFRTYSTPEESFWCCVGSGMENHTKYGAAIYFHDSHDVYVNLFIPSVLSWREKGLILEQRTRLSGEQPHSADREISAGATHALAAALAGLGGVAARDPDQWQAADRGCEPWAIRCRRASLAARRHDRSGHSDERARRSVARLVGTDCLYLWPGGAGR